MSRRPNPFLLRHVANQLNQVYDESSRATIYVKTKKEDLDRFRREASRPDLTDREAEAWLVQYGRKKALRELPFAAGPDMFRPTGKLRPEMDSVMKTICDVSVVHGHDRMGRVVHYERPGLLNIDKIRNKHTMENIIRYKHLELSYYLRVARHRAWVRYVMEGKIEELRQAVNIPEQEEKWIEKQLRKKPWQTSVTELQGTGQLRSVIRRREPVDAESRKRIDQLLENVSRFNGQMISVLDMRGTSSAHVGSFARAFCRNMSRMSETRMPDGPHRVVVVHAPWIIKAAWRAVKPLVNRRMARTVEIHSGPAYKRLCELIEPSKIPKELGGECKCKSNGCLSRHAPEQRRKLRWIRGKVSQHGTRVYLDELLNDKYAASQDQIFNSYDDDQSDMESEFQF